MRLEMDGLVDVERLEIPEPGVFLETEKGDSGRVDCIFTETSRAFQVVEVATLDALVFRMMVDHFSFSCSKSQITEGSGLSSTCDVACVICTSRIARICSSLARLVRR